MMAKNCGSTQGRRKIEVNVVEEMEDEKKWRKNNKRMAFKQHFQFTCHKLYFILFLRLVGWTSCKFLLIRKF